MSLDMNDIDQERATLLLEELTDTLLRIDHYHKLRDHLIRAAREHGVSIATIAAAAGIKSRTTIYKILKERPDV